VDATTLVRQAEALGSSLSAGAGASALSLGMTVTTPKLDAAVALMADVLRRPLLARAELERSRRQMSDALRVSLADPAALAGMVARRLQWGDAPGGAVPTPDSLARVQRADLLAFHQHWVRPDAAALLLAGDIDLPRAQALARRHLGDWAAPAQPLPSLADPAPQPRLGPLLLIDLPGSGQSSVVLVGGFSALGDADRRIGQVANAVLGGGYSARLNQAVRVQRGLAYGAGSRAESGEQGGLWLARTQTDHRNALAVAQLLHQEVARLADQPPTAEELGARQASLTGGFARGLETTAGLAGQVAELWIQRRPWSALADFAREVQAVQPAQVADYARRHWGADRLRVVVVGDGSAAPADWSALGAQPLRLPAAQLDLGSPTLGLPAR
jgi:zinc protease